MPNNLNITKGLSTEVQVTIAGSPEIHGNFFLADHAKSHYGEETLLDLLNQPDKQFIPFAQSDELPVVLLQKAKILGLRPQYANSAHWPKIDNTDDHYWPGAIITFPNFTLEGRAYTGDMQPERRRLTDLLNHANSFFIFDTDEGPWIINKNLMNHLEPTSEKDAG